MSRIGRKPIPIPSSIKVERIGNKIVVEGPKGKLKLDLHPDVNVEISDKQIFVTVKDERIKFDRSLWGLFRKLIFNMVEGVTKGFEKKLEVNGVGYKVALSGKKLILHLGFSHPIEFALPDGIEAEVDKNIITIKGIDKQQVGEVAAQIRRLRKPEPYKGKGIKYSDEVIRKKAGKAAKAVGSAGT